MYIREVFKTITEDNRGVLGVTFFTHITKRLSLCSILINYESVKFSFKFSLLFFKVF